METICITRKICIDGNKLDKNIKAHLLQKIIELTSNECSKEYGHILKIENLEEIVTNTISNANSNIVFTVKFKAVVFKPVEGEKISGKVCMIFETGGIFIEILEKSGEIKPARVGLTCRFIALATGLNLPKPLKKSVFFGAF